LIQDRAVGTDLDKRFVFVVKQDKTVEYRPVTLGPLVDGLRVVRSGLKAGEQIVVSGLQRIRPGSTIEPVVTAMDNTKPDMTKPTDQTADAASAAAPDGRKAEQQ
jgi:multidrug efflux system membrane fusion protein